MALLVLVLVAAGLFYIMVNYSETRRDFACRGNYRFNSGQETEPDEGRLRISEFRWWVLLWADRKETGDARVLFQSKKVAYYYTRQVNVSGDSGFGLYSDFDPKKKFLFREATGEVGLVEYKSDKPTERWYTFTGECVQIGN